MVNRGPSPNMTTESPLSRVWVTSDLPRRCLDVDLFKLGLWEWNSVVADAGDAGIPRSDGLRPIFQPSFRRFSSFFFARNGSCAETDSFLRARRDKLCALLVFPCIVLGGCMTE